MILETMFCMQRIKILNICIEKFVSGASAKCPVSVQTVCPYRRCVRTDGVSVQTVCPYRRCVRTDGVSVQTVCPYRRCVRTDSVSVQTVCPYSIASTHSVITASS
jgi:hypothetical protein